MTWNQLLKVGVRSGELAGAFPWLVMVPESVVALPTVSELGEAPAALLMRSGWFCTQIPPVMVYPPGQMVQLGGFVAPFPQESGGMIVSVMVSEAEPPPPLQVRVY